MRVLSLAAPLLLSTSVAHALPRRNSNQGVAWTSAFHSAWEVFRDSAVGWSGIDVYDELEHPFRAPDKTVLEWLESKSDFSNITKLIKYDEQITHILSEASHGLSFLAPNNQALTHPKKPRDLADIHYHHQDALNHLSVHGDSLFSNANGDDDDKDKEKKKKMFKAILNAILNYHILPYDVSSTDLGLNSTVQTNLVPKDGSCDGQNRRIKVEKSLVPPTIKINGYSTIVKGDNKATNGYIHELDHALLPPPSVLLLAHLYPQFLSTSTSAVQKVGLEDAIDWHYVHSKSSDHFKGSFEGTPSVTVFIPDNEAWKKLPERLILYLFSPVGEKVLTKLLQFHVVPKYIIHSEWIYNADHKAELKTTGTEMDFKYSFPTALKGYTLPVHIKKTTPTIPIPGIAYFDFNVFGQKLDNDKMDIVARNGAVHIVTTVLNPRKRKQNDDDNEEVMSETGGWEDWEEWLPAWANEE